MKAILRQCGHVRNGSTLANIFQAHSRRGRRLITGSFYRPPFLRQGKIRGIKQYNYNTKTGKLRVKRQGSSDGMSSVSCASGP